MRLMVNYGFKNNYEIAREERSCFIRKNIEKIAQRA